MASLGRKPGAAALTSADIPDNSITAAKIVEGTITVGDIGTNAVGADELANDAVDTNAIANDAVTEDKLANTLLAEIDANTAKVTNATHTGHVTGGTALTIADDAVDSQHYAAGSIDNEHLADDAVGTDELANDVAISTSGAITTTGAFTSVGIDDNAVGATAITIDSSENVGIGSAGTTPERPLHVKSGDSGVTPSPVSLLCLETASGSNYLSMLSGTNDWQGILFGSNTNDGQGAMYYGGGTAGDKFLFYTAGTNRVTIGSAGDVTLASGNLVIGTGGKGITFSTVNTPAQSAGTGTHNTLDDYEEGTWTPSLGGTTTYITQLGSYTKIGRVVTATVYLGINSIGNGSARVISGLPFTAASFTGTLSISWWRDFASNANYMAGYIYGAATCTMYANSTPTNSYASIDIFQNSTYLQGTMTYLV